jgi:two-component system sensor histidine kinase VicK
VKFTPEGGKVRIEASPRDRFVEISISDNGIGIPKDQHEVIFDKFYQVQAATESGVDGTRLGKAWLSRSD